MEEIKRLNTEKKIDNSFFNLKIGTTNKKNPLAIYIDGKTYISPTFSSENYEKSIYNIRQGFRKKINSNLLSNTLFDKNFIMDFQLASNCLSKGKRSFLSIQLILKQKSKVPLQIKDLKEKGGLFVTNVVNDFAYEITSNGYEIYKTKR